MGEMTDDEDGLDVDLLREKREDMRIVSLALLGRSIHEVYSNSRIDIAVARQSAEGMILMSADVTEIFSPERRSARFRGRKTPPTFARRTSESRLSSSTWASCT